MRNILLLTTLLFWIPGSILKADIFYVGANEKINNSIKQGIIVTASDSCEISEDTLTGNATGIMIGRSSTGYTSVYNCDIRNNNNGILSYGEVKIRRSTIENNADMGIFVREKGIDLGQQNSENGGYNTIRNNAIWNLVNETQDTVMACHNYWTYIQIPSGKR